MDVSKVREWQENNKDKYNEYQREYRQANKRYWKQYRQDRMFNAIYMLQDEYENIIRIGSSTDLYNRMVSYFNYNSGILEDEVIDLIDNVIYAEIPEELNRYDLFFIEGYLKDVNEEMFEGNSIRISDGLSKTEEELIDIANNLAWKDYDISRYRDR